MQPRGHGEVVGAAGQLRELGPPLRPQDALAAAEIRLLVQRQGTCLVGRLCLNLKLFFLFIAFFFFFFILTFFFFIIITTTIVRHIVVRLFIVIWQLAEVCQGLLLGEVRRRRLGEGGEEEEGAARRRRRRSRGRTWLGLTTTSEVREVTKLLASASGRASSSLPCLSSCCTLRNAWSRCRNLWAPLLCTNPQAPGTTP